MSKRTAAAISQNSLITPMRVIPFDIGLTVTPAISAKLQSTLKSYSSVALTDMQTAIAHELLLGFQIKKDIKLYIFRYGIGVFVIKDSDYIINNENG
jgi:hypothetical protein